EKRPISMETISNLVSDIEDTVKNEGVNEVKSSVIGEIIISKLRILDEVAYVRFASVYRQFKDVSSFVKEIKKLSH
ncbi:MAG: transcriptional regulator NrdR, partial [Candidatus Infernicultor aquiphilus]